MSLSLLLVALLGWSFSASAAQTYKIPIVIVPGSVTFQGQGDYSPVGPPVSVTFPISKQVTGVSPNCAAALVTVAAEVIDGGLELGINGYAAGPGCDLGGEVVFEVEMQAPELGGTTTSVRLVPQVKTFSFLDYARVFASIGA